MKSRFCGHSLSLQCPRFANFMDIVDINYYLSKDFSAVEYYS